MQHRRQFVLLLEVFLLELRTPSWHFHEPQIPKQKLRVVLSSLVFCKVMQKKKNPYCWSRRSEVTRDTCRRWLDNSSPWPTCEPSILHNTTNWSDMLATEILFLTAVHKTPPKPSLNGCYKVDDSSREVYLLFYWIYSETTERVLHDRWGTG